MRHVIQFVVEGIAEPKGSTRMVPTAYSGTKITSANPKLKDWQEDVAWAAQQAYRGEPLTGAVAVTMTFYLPRPKSLPLSQLRHTRTPDLDKLVRGICDALTGVCYCDDKQVVDVHAFKRYAVFTPQTTVVVEELGDV